MMGLMPIDESEEGRYPIKVLFSAHAHAGEYFVEAGVFTLLCPNCCFQLPSTYAYLGNRYGQIGSTWCFNCEKDIHCVGPDYISYKMSMFTLDEFDKPQNKMDVDFAKLYLLETENLTRLAERTSYDIIATETDHTLYKLLKEVCKITGIDFTSLERYKSSHDKRFTLLPKSVELWHDLLCKLDLID